MQTGEAKPAVMLCGPARGAVSGVATHLNQLFSSDLAGRYAFAQFQVGSEGRGESAVGKVVRLVASPFQLLSKIISDRPEIVHLNTSLDQKAYWRDLVYLLVARMLGCRVVYQVHGGSLPADFLGHGRLAKAFLRWSLNLPDVVVVLAEIERKAYLSFGAGRRIRVIPNAIDLHDYRGCADKNYKSGPVLLGYLGRLVMDKGIRETLQALALLRERSQQLSLKFRIAGTGPGDAGLRQLTHDLALDGIVEFIGPVFGEEKFRFWKEVGLFVFPSYREGLPYVILEAMASGTPVIATRVGGIPDVVRNDVQGILIDDHDPESIATAIANLISDPGRLAKMSAAAVGRACEYYGMQRLSYQIDELYREVLD